MDRTVTARNCYDHNDPDMVAMHSFFTCMCIHVEEERGGEQALVEYIAFVRESEAETYHQHGASISGQYPTCADWVNHKARPHEETLRLYRWYQTADWSRVNEDDFLDECSQRIKEAADCMWSWWT